MVEITGVLPRSRADRAGIRSGDILLEINSYPIRDVLDYRFRLAEKTVVLKLHRGPEILEVKIRKDTYDDIGLEFGTPLMDRKHRCENACVFCFIDQNPKGMRDTIYFKDDDSRLSFLHGNYITLTNLQKEDIDRIIEMHISPVNISVHTTNPELRVRMMKNKRSGEVLGYLDMLYEAGTLMRGQIVLCRSINDGAELERTMTDLSRYYPVMDSVSIVPCGLTGHREGLYHIDPFSAEECRQVISQVAEFNKRFGNTMFYASDEFYVKGNVDLPDEEYYGEYPQIENGVGLLTSFGTEFMGALGRIETDEFTGERKVSVATGEAAFAFISKLTGEAEKKFPGFTCMVYSVRNDFFGGEVTVSGLLTGGDIQRQLKGKDLGETLFLPRTSLRAEGDLFLDDMSPGELSSELGVPVAFNDNDGADFLYNILGI
ncbi:MAG: DUF512 domain-containing protein [Clostridia bacterium]|nr:DUF512 domain-containing protein [Clostridia bacterium]